MKKNLTQRPPDLSSVELFDLAIFSMTWRVTSSISLGISLLPVIELKLQDTLSKSSNFLWNCENFMLSILKFILHVGQKLSDSNLDFINFAKQEKQNICLHIFIVTDLLRTLYKVYIYTMIYECFCIHQDQLL